MDRTDVATKPLSVGDLTPRSKNFNVTAKVLTIGESREIPGRHGGPSNRVAEALVGDPTGNVLLSLWNDQINDVREGESLHLQNAYVTLVRGHMRLNVGKYGTLGAAEDDVEADIANTNLSDAEHESERRGPPRRGGFGGGGGGRGGGGYRGGGGRGGPRF